MFQKYMLINISKQDITVRTYLKRIWLIHVYVNNCGAICDTL